ncbi:membrane protein [Propionigenium maris DSM 9537]|uniref:Membrane protein n=1 Tax=Propionigenium maris DSM 9537 TaxID=1123000 RepID=A0A9W6GMI0_9FUSO|nr:DUF2721 domain-containing protein [Propionigenium maris]GLI56531.1 membrane protein [Propionigenium maris DSM 9537]
MKLTLTTPALLFSTVSLLMVAYTTRFMGLAGLIRVLHERKKESEPGDKNLQLQLELLRRRVQLIKNMQILGVMALILSITSIAFLFFEKLILGEVAFMISLLLLLGSLILSVIEIYDSVKALEVQLDECRGCKCKV